MECGAQCAVIIGSIAVIPIARFVIRAPSRPTKV